MTRPTGGSAVDLTNQRIRWTAFMLAAVLSVFALLIAAPGSSWAAEDSDPGSGQCPPDGGSCADGGGSGGGSSGDSAGTAGDAGAEGDSASSYGDSGDEYPDSPPDYPDDQDQCMSSGPVCQEDDTDAPVPDPPVDETADSPPTDAPETDPPTPPPATPTPDQPDPPKPDQPDPLKDQYQQCLATAADWATQCQDRGNIVCSVVGGKVGGEIGGGKGGAVGGAIYGMCDAAYNQMCREGQAVDVGECNQQLACRSAGGGDSCNRPLYRILHGGSLGSPWRD